MAVPSPSRSPTRFAAAAASAYGALGVLWILFSDALVSALPLGPGAMHLAQSFKGVVFVGATAAGLFVLLARANRRYRDFVEHSPIGIFRLGLDGRLLAVNPAIAASTGHAGPGKLLAAVGDRPRELFADPAAYDRFIDELRSNGQVPLFEAATRGRHGAIRWMILTARTASDPRGVPSHYEGTAVDITARKASERALTEAQERLVRLQRLSAVGEVAATAAHDFNNALTPVLGYAEILMDSAPGRTPEQVTRYAGLIHRGAEDAARIVQRLRALAKPRPAGAGERVDLGVVARETIELTAPRWQGRHADGARPLAVRAETSGAPAVRGDPAALREALTNLLYNAVDASPRGGTITVRAASRDGRAVLEVADEGEGMTNEVRRRCLEPFFTTKGDGGTGLGLASVQRIVHEHGGAIAVDSVPGRGTTFALSFPPA